jgi:hypothetical protein
MKSSVAFGLASLVCIFMLGTPAHATETVQHSVTFSIDAAGQLLWVCPEDSEYRSYQSDYMMHVLQSAAPYPAPPSGAGEHAEFRATVISLCGKFLDCVVTKVESTNGAPTKYSLSQLCEMAQRQTKLSRRPSTK